MKSVIIDTIKYLRAPILLTIIFSILSIFVFNTTVTPLTVFYCILISAMYSFGLGLGSGYLAGILDKYYNWIEDTRRRVIIGSIINIVYLLIIIISVDIFIIKLLEHRDLNALLSASRIWKNVLIFFISAAISTFYHAKSFMTYWKASVIRQKELEKENIASQYEALKSQTDPHFFFNSLNSLSSLIEEDKELSQKFIKELANIYRYILEQKDNELSLISDELTFIEKYIFLQKIRIENGVTLNVNVDNNVKNKKTISLALQILFENIFKHNSISEDTPIVINIKSEADYIIVENNINPKRTKTISNKIGLENIKARYSFFTDEDVIIENTKDSFAVKLPLITSN